MSIRIDEYGNIHRDTSGSGGSSGSSDNERNTGQTSIEMERNTTPWYKESTYFWLLTILLGGAAYVLLQIFVFSKIYRVITGNEVHATVAVVIGIIGGFVICILYNVRGTGTEYLPRNYALSIMASIAGSLAVGFAVSIIWGIIVAAILIILLFALAG